MLTCSAILSAAGLYWLSFANNMVMAFAAATVFGVGIAYFWPTMLGVTAERFPKGGALVLGLMGCVGNLSIAFVLPQMGAIYDSYSVHALMTEAPDLQAKKVAIEKDGKTEPVPLVMDEEGTTAKVENKIRGWLPVEVRDRLYPGGTKKLDPAAVTALDKQAHPKEGEPPPEARELDKHVKEAEKTGAAWAFRWVAVLPCVLVVVFGLITLVNKLRGGYKAVHIGGEAPKQALPPAKGYADGAPEK
jgi:hypothetical protein